jgi:hypothetical protein
LCFIAQNFSSSQSLKIELKNLAHVMSIDKFTRLMEKQERCPESVPSSLQALWYDKRDWDKADQMVRDASDLNIAWLPA